MNKLHPIYLKDGASVAKGSTTLSIIPKEMNCIDLLVREAIQNSSDARRLNDPKPFVGVDFDIGEFDPQAFNSLFKNDENDKCNVEGELNRRFGGKRCLWLSITDYNTEGLNGNIKPDSLKDRSNFCRLVNDTGEAQTKEGAGGSCGYGKSAYYRLGDAGIVLFYSRFVDESGNFRSRLVVTLVEDEKKEDAILVRAGIKSSAGKAWWGAGETENWIRPIEDEDQIAKILGIFGIQRYEDIDFPNQEASKTGTKIIIPYIDEERIRHSLVTGRTDNLKEDQKKQVGEMTKDLPTAIKYAVLRWYSPRLGNRYLKVYNAYHEGRRRIAPLTVRVCGEPVHPDPDKIDFFCAVQDLYNRALYEILQANTPKTHTIKPPHYEIFLKKIQCEKCETRGILRNTLAGVVAFEVFQSKTPSNISPYLLTNNFASAGQTSNPAMLFFLRDPGMVIGYSTTDEWLKNVPEKEGSEYLLAVFYPNSSNSFKTGDATVPEQLWGKTVGEYFRSCEQADHTSWKDQNGGRLVQRVKASCANKILKIVDEPAEMQGDGSVGRLARFIGQRLLLRGKPPVKPQASDMPRDPAGEAGCGKARVAKNGKNAMVLSDYRHPGANLVSMSFKMQLSSGAGKERILLNLSTSDELIDPFRWQDRRDLYDGAFPLSLVEVRVQSVVAGGQASNPSIKLRPGAQTGSASCAGCQFSMLESDRRAAIGLDVGWPPDKEVYVEGTFTVRVANPILRFMLRFANV